MDSHAEIGRQLAEEIERALLDGHSVVVSPSRVAAALAALDKLFAAGTFTDADVGAAALRNALRKAAN